MTKRSVQKQTHRPAHKHAEHQDATDIQKIIIFFCDFSDFLTDIKVEATARSRLTTLHFGMMF